MVHTLVLKYRASSPLQSVDIRVVHSDRSRRTGRPELSAESSTRPASWPLCRLPLPPPTPPCPCSAACRRFDHRTAGVMVGRAAVAEAEARALSGRGSPCNAASHLRMLKAQLSTCAARTQYSAFRIVPLQGAYQLMRSQKMLRSAAQAQHVFTLLVYAQPQLHRQFRARS